MTKEEKQLLLKDLSARLPYRVKVKYYSMDYPYGSEPVILTPYLLWNRWENISDMRPYLRPMSSMTEEEETLFRCELPAIAKTDAHLVAMRMELFLKGHLDFNHLIEKGLALEAPKDMYKTE